MSVGRVHMAVPVSGMTPARRERNGNKHKRLFMGGPGGLTVHLLAPHIAVLQSDLSSRTLLKPVVHICSCVVLHVQMCRSLLCSDLQNHNMRLLCLNLLSKHADKSLTLIHVMEQGCNPNAKWALRFMLLGAAW